MHGVRLSVREDVLSSPDLISETDYITAMGRLVQSWVVQGYGQIGGFASDRNTGNSWAVFGPPRTTRVAAMADCCMPPRFPGCGSLA